jgi:cytochrome c oxidase assembly protein subunit 11
MTAKHTTQSSNALIRKMVWSSVGAFAFCFAMIPLYQIYCEVTGANGKTGKASTAETVDHSREIKVQFDGAVNSQLPWTFKPLAPSMKVHPGAVNLAKYTVTNLSDRPIVGKAVPSVAPNDASLYFDKTECFCFTEQKLLPGETMELPVRFIVHSEIPKEHKVLTLSYTFYADEVATRKLSQSPIAAVQLGAGGRDPLP